MKQGYETPETPARGPVSTISRSDLGVDATT